MKRELKTKDLVLGKVREENFFDLWHNYWSDGVSARYMLWSVCKTEESARKRFERLKERQKTEDLWAIFYQGKAIGVAGIMETEPHVFEDTGWGMGSIFTGHGLGKQMMDAILEFCFVDLKAKKLNCSVDSLNIPSIKMQDRAGMKLTHQTNEVRMRDGTEFVANHYEITREEYFEKQKEKKL